MTITPIYMNGGAPNYSGFVFADGTELLSKIRETLELATWYTEQYTAGTNLLMRGTTDNSHQCYVEFKIVANTTLTMRGWHDSAKTIGSPDDIHNHSFAVGGQNRLWLTADNDSGAICVYDGSTGNSVGSHFGFLQRIDVSDQWAWMVGFVRVDGVEFAYSAKLKLEDANWGFLKNGYFIPAPLPDYPAGKNTYPMLTQDLVTIGKPYVTDSMSEDRRSAFQSAFAGRRNYNGQPVISPYAYLEGKNSTDYDANSRLAFRGYVKHVFCGVASEPATTQVLDPLSDSRILSTGGSRWQGMRIK